MTLDDRRRALQDEVRERDDERDGVIRFLWELLDDIDTYDDMAKFDDHLYRDLVRRTQQRRWETGITSDGYTLDLSKAHAPVKLDECGCRRGTTDGCKWLEPCPVHRAEKYPDGDAPSNNLPMRLFSGVTALAERRPITFQVHGATGLDALWHWLFGDRWLAKRAGKALLASTYKGLDLATTTLIIQTPSGHFEVLDVRGRVRPCRADPGLPVLP